MQVNHCTVVASSIIHADTFHRVVYSTIEFIWNNPVGAVANRFSRDVGELDLILPNTLKNFIFQVYFYVHLFHNTIIDFKRELTHLCFFLKATRILGTLFLVVFTFPANIFTMVFLVAGIVVVFKAYIRVSRLFRRLASATMGSLNAFLTEHVNGVQVIR